MLARIFRPPEATSIWVELVQQRKKEIEAECSKNAVFGMELIAAAQAARQDISRAQLAEWDASARAWLLSADEFKVKEHTQLMLLVKNCSLPVNARNDVYQSVTSAWTAALTAAESLIKGMPQRVQNGAILLGLSAWHIYPDVVIIMNPVKHVKFADSLVEAGGLLTISLQAANEDEARGVYWSLSLAHLRFYGDPVFSTGEIGPNDKQRVTFNELGIVTLGCIAAEWRYQDELQVLEAAEWFVILREYLSRFCHHYHSLTQSYENARSREHQERQLHSGCPSQSSQANGLSLVHNPACLDCRRLSNLVAETESQRKQLPSMDQTGTFVTRFLQVFPNWLRFLAKSSQLLLGSQGQKREEFIRLVKLGLRRGRVFLGGKGDYSEPIFGLARPNVFLMMLSENDRVQHLRRIALAYGLDTLPKGSVIIRYRREDLDQGLYRYEFATAVPYVLDRGRSDALEAPDARHYRFIGSCRRECKVLICNCKSSPAKCTSERHSHIRTKEYCPISLSSQSEDRQRCSEIESLGEEYICFADSTVSENLVGESDINYSVSPGSIEDAHQFTWTDVPGEISGERSSSRPKDAHFYFICGDPHLAAIYVCTDGKEAEQVRKLREWRLTPEDYKKLMCKDGFQIDVQRLFTCISGFPGNDGYKLRPEDEPHREIFENWKTGLRMTCYAALNALAAADTVYSSIPSATVSLNVMSYPLWDALWAKSSSSSSLLYCLRPDRAETFACIAYFDSGKCNPDPVSLTQVMAISMGNSIYIAAPLLDDPSVVHPRYAVKRVIGNLGRSGVIMLMPPKDPKVKKSDVEAWQVINHYKFDDTKEDCFGGTSMHLSFTGYEIPVSLGSHGQQDSEAYLLECVISVDDKGEWIADLDILGLLNIQELEFPLPEELRDHIRQLKRLQRCKFQCNHVERGIGSAQLVAIDQWHELLDPPMSAGVVRAHGNWVGRLATAVTAFQKGHKVYIIEGDACWACLREIGLLDDTKGKEREESDQPCRIFIY